MKITDYKIAKKSINAKWYLFDAKDYVLGRLASKIATLLMGKHKASYSPLFDSGDYVVVINAKDIKLTGFKAEQKKYHRHTGYIGNLKTTTYKEMIAKKPDFVIYHAVQKMLPKTVLAKKMIKKLRIYPGSEHPHQNVKFVE